MKLLAFYLPQYHEIPENNEWWGKGYTEWTAVKNAKQYFKNQNQPVEPLNDRYYDLVKEGRETWEWQASLAKKYGIDAFCIYHYWFEGKKLLEKPMEILLENKDIDINYTICWANETWARNWDGEFNHVLIKQTYGMKEDWISHFQYLLPFFKDSRYIKRNNKPVVHIYKSQNIENLSEMLQCWNTLAKKEGFSGVEIISAITAGGKDDRKELIDYYYYFEPGYTLKWDYGIINRKIYLCNSMVRKAINYFRKRKLLEHIASARHTWKRIENRKYQKKIYLGTFISWDNTPRRKEKGTVYRKSTPDLFGIHMKKMISKIPDDAWLYINAWNEWGEGSYLEPDKKYQYRYLEAIKNVKGC